MKKNKTANLQDLLQIKKSETPGELYFDHFLDEFHRYQRAEILEEKEKGILTKLLEQFSDFTFFQPQRLWAYGTSLALFFVVFGVLLFSQLENQSPVYSGAAVSQLEPEMTSHMEAASLYTNYPMQQAELLSASLSSFDKDFEGSRYVTGQDGLIYETTLAF